MLLTVTVRIIDLFTQLPAVFLCQDRLDPRDQGVIRRVKFPFDIDVELLLFGKKAVDKQIPVLRIPHQSILRLDYNDIEPVACQIFAKTIVLAPSLCCCS